MFLQGSLTVLVWEANSHFIAMIYFSFNFIYLNYHFILIKQFIVKLLSCIFFVYSLE